MAVTYTDSEIATLISERKQLPSGFNNPKFISKADRIEVKLNAIGDDGHVFHIVIRQNSDDPDDFSVILAVRLRPSPSEQLFHLLRYDGKSHEHTNHLESTRRCKDTFCDFHIHIATARYQESKRRDDGYAEITDRYTDIHGAIRCLLEDAGFYPINYQTIFSPPPWGNE